MILVDFDKTLATYHSGNAKNKFPLGEPIPAMVDRVKYWLAKGKEVRIFTARASRDNPYLTEDMANIKAWCKKHLGQELEVQNWKDFRAEAIWDDLAVSVEANTGRVVRRLDLDIQE